MRCNLNDIYKRMCFLVERDRLYLDPHLSLIRLSVITGTNTLYLSRAINTYCGKNFRSMLNDYRIAYAKELLMQNLLPRLNFKEFHRKCGYVSKSAFYTAFKERLHMTPKEFMSESLGKTDWEKLKRESTANAGTGAGGEATGNETPALAQTLRVTNVQPALMQDRHGTAKRNIYENA